MKLTMDKIPSDAYDFNDGRSNEAYCLILNVDEWEVYYSERGQKSGLAKFKSEEDACLHFYKTIKRDSGLYPR